MGRGRIAGLVLDPFAGRPPVLAGVAAIALAKC